MSNASRLDFGANFAHFGSLLVPFLLHLDCFVYVFKYILTFYGAFFFFPFLFFKNMILSTQGRESTVDSR